MDDQSLSHTRWKSQYLIVFVTGFRHHIWVLRVYAPCRGDIKPPLEVVVEEMKKEEEKDGRNGVL